MYQGFPFADVFVAVAWETVRLLPVLRLGTSIFWGTGLRERFKTYFVVMLVKLGVVKTQIAELENIRIHRHNGFGHTQ